MSRLRSALTLAALGAAALTTGCAHHGHAGTAAAGAAAPVALTWPALEGERAHRDTFENGDFKVGLITLAGGATLPSHAAPVPVVLMASGGAGTVELEGASHPLDPAHAVYLPARAAHRVVAAAGEPLRITVVGARGGQATAACEHHAH